MIGLWQAAENRGIQATNVPGSWNFTVLHTADPDGAERFYGAVFGWVRERFQMPDGTEIGSYFRQPGYGDFLAAADPEIRERQAADQAPGGFADAVALLGPDEGTGTRWATTFAVANAEAAVAQATELGATVVAPLIDTPYTREGVVRDPQGATLTLSEYRPPTG